MENAGFLLAAFGIIWVVIFGYVILLLKRQRALRRDIESLKETLRQHGKE